jgi:uncharacterized membrane protein
MSLLLVWRGSGNLTWVEMFGVGSKTALLLLILETTNDYVRFHGELHQVNTFSVIICGVG